MCVHPLLLLPTYAHIPWQYWKLFLLNFNSFFNERTEFLSIYAAFFIHTCCCLCTRACMPNNNHNICVNVCMCDSKMRLSRKPCGPESRSQWVWSVRTLCRRMDTSTKSLRRRRPSNPCHTSTSCRALTWFLIIKLILLRQGSMKFQCCWIGWCVRVCMRIYTSCDLIASSAEINRKWGTCAFSSHPIHTYIHPNANFLTDQTKKVLKLETMLLRINTSLLHYHAVDIWTQVRVHYSPSAWW